MICIEGGPTNARINDGEGVVGLVRNDVDVEFWVAFQEILVLVLQALKFNLVQGIAGIRDELTEEDFLYKYLSFAKQRYRLSHVASVHRRTDKTLASRHTRSSSFFSANCIN